MLLKLIKKVEFAPKVSGTGSHFYFFPHHMFLLVVKFVYCISKFPSTSEASVTNPMMVFNKAKALRRKHWKIVLRHTDC